jgi:hypothetical protein
MARRPDRLRFARALCPRSALPSCYPTGARIPPGKVIVWKNNRMEGVI